jgi:hypothetical protein
MATFDMFSRRRKPASAVLTYDEIPQTLRIQLLTAMNDARHRIYDRTIPSYHCLGTEGEDCFAAACQILRRELGLVRLVDAKVRVRRPGESVIDGLASEFAAFFESCETEHVLDAIEVVMRLIENSEDCLDHECDANTVTDEINARFRQHSIGYQYESGQIVEETSRVLHAEATVPALHLLSDPVYGNANDEFLKAHEHYRHGRYPECLNECLKAFESTMKIICDAKYWPYNQNDTASKLIKACLDNDLVPTFSEQQLTSLRTLLESGIPTLRNKRGGHGQGVEKADVPDSLAKFALHLTAAAIVLLTESANLSRT